MSEMGFEKQLGEIDLREAARKELKQKIVQYFEEHNYTYKDRKVDKAEFYQQFTAMIQKLPNITAQTAQALAAQTAGEALAGEIQPIRDEIRRVQEQYEFRTVVLEQAVAFLNSLLEFDFLSKTLDRLQVSASFAKIEGDAEKIKQGLAEMKALDETLKAALTTDAGGSEAVEQRRHAIRAAIKTYYDLLMTLEKATKDMTEVGSKMPKVIEGAALSSYFEKHPTESMKQLESFNKGAEFVIGFGGAFAPPGYGWISGLVDTVRDLAGRAANEGLKAVAAKKHSAEHMAGTIFEKFTEEPLLMAKALNSTISKNVESLLTALSIATSEIKGFSIITKGIQQLVDQWLDRRIKLAEDALAALKLSGTPAAQAAETLKEKLTVILKEMREEAGEGLLDKLKEGDFWGEIVKQVQDAEFNTEWAVGLVTPLLNPLAAQLVKVLPVTPAQVVTGEDLAKSVDAASIMQSIPPKYRVKPDPTKDDSAVIRHPVPIATLVGTYQGTVVDSNAGKDQPGDGTENRAYVAFLCYGTKVWGFLVGPDSKGEARWEPETIDVHEGNAPWAQRQITDDGYIMANGTKVVDGKWYIPEAEAMRGNRLYVHSDGKTGEWLRTITRTRLGNAGELFRRIGELPKNALVPD